MMCTKLYAKQPTSKKMTIMTANLNVESEKGGGSVLIFDRLLVQFGDGIFSVYAATISVAI